MPESSYDPSLTRTSTSGSTWGGGSDKIVTSGHTFTLKDTAINPIGVIETPTIMVHVGEETHAVASEKLTMNPQDRSVAPVVRLTMTPEQYNAFAKSFKERYDNADFGDLAQKEKAVASLMKDRDHLDEQVDRLENLVAFLMETYDIDPDDLTLASE